MSKTHRHATPDSPFNSPTPHKKLAGQTLFLWGAVAVSGIVLAVLAFIIFRGPQAAGSQLKLEKIPFNGVEAYDYLKQLCDLGPRRSGSQAMIAQQKFLANHSEKLGAKVEYQRFTVPYPADGPDKQMIGRQVPMVNMIVRFNPAAQANQEEERAANRERIMICGHYDTLPFPLHDPDDQHGRFVGANDNGSGIAILMELGKELASIRPRWASISSSSTAKSSSSVTKASSFGVRNTLPTITQSIRRPFALAMPCCWTWWAGPIWNCPRSSTV